MDSTKPASHSSRRCFDTVGCGIRSWRSISPTECCAETRRLNIARRFGSAMISNTDSTLLIYFTEHMRVKVYIKTIIRKRGFLDARRQRCGGLAQFEAEVVEVAFRHRMGAEFVDDGP